MLPNSDSLKYWREVSDTWLQNAVRHMVAIVGTYSAKEAPNPRQRARAHFCYSAFIVDLGGDWWLVTAGHVVHGLQKADRDDIMFRSAGYLVDDLNPVSKHHDPVPFWLLDQPVRVGIYDQELGLDFHLTQLNPLYRDNLKANGIEALPVHWKRGEDYEGLTHFAVLGIPNEFICNDVDESTKRGHIDAQVTLVPISRTECEPDEGQAPKFVGHIIDMGSQQSIVGMSGGPIFGLRSDGEQFEYEVVAIQSSWDKGSRTIYGCPLDVAKEVVDRVLELKYPELKQT